MSVRRGTWLEDLPPPSVQHLKGAERRTASYPSQHNINLVRCMVHSLARMHQTHAPISGSKHVSVPYSIIPVGLVIIVDYVLLIPLIFTILFWLSATTYSAGNELSLEELPQLLLRHCEEKSKKLRIVNSKTSYKSMVYFTLRS